MKEKYFRKYFLKTLVPIFALIALFGLPSIVFAWSYSTRVVNKSTSDLLSLTKYNMELILNESMFLLNSLDENVDNRVDLKDFFYTDNYSYEKIRTHNNLANIVNSPTNIRGYIHSIYVYLDNPYSNLLVSNIGLTKVENNCDQSWLDSYKNQSKDVYVWAERREIKKYSFEKEPQKVISMFLRFKHIRGLLVLNIKNSALVEMIGKTGAFKDQQLVITTKEGEVIFNNKEELPLPEADITDTREKVGERFSIDGQKYIVSTLYNLSYEWNYISLVPQHSAYQISYSMVELILIVGALGIAVSVIIAYFQTQESYRHLNDIVDMFSAAEVGKEIPVLTKTPADDPYLFITQNITRVFLVENNLRMQVMQQKMAEEEAEIQALQLQLNPHFLYNTLEYINEEMLCLFKKPTSVNHMILGISQILRYSLKDNKKRVPLYEEYENTNRYVGIMNYRHEGNLSVLWDSGHHVMECMVLKFIFQLLVENAILHGIRDPGTGIVVRISVKEADNGMISIRVLDNGSGISREDLPNIRKNLQNPEKGNHIGLYNINRRLMLTYGDRFKFRMLSTEGKGTSIRILIPQEYE